MPNILQAELVIKGSDKTAAAFQGVIAHARELQNVLGRMGGMGINDVQLKRAQQEAQRLTSIVRTQNSAWSAINSTIALGNRYLQERIGLMQRMGGAAKAALANSAYWLGPAVLYGTRAAIKTGANIESEKSNLAAAGVPTAEIDAITARAPRLAAAFPNVGIAEILERYRELRSVIAHPDEAPHLIEAAIKAASVIKSLGLSTEGLPFAFKSAEVQGLAQDPQRFTDFLDSYVRALQVSGKTLDPETMLRGAQQLKASAALLSDRFKSTTYLSMLQDMGSRAGAGVNQAVAMIIGDFRSRHAAAKEWTALGLANAEDFDRTKTGEIKGLKPGHHIKDWQLGSRNLDFYVWEKLVPALVAHGFKSQEEQIAEVMRLFPDKRASDVISKIIQQEASFRQHAVNYAHAFGLDAADTLGKKPPSAWEAFKLSLQDFAGTLTEPYIKSAGEALKNLAHGIRYAGVALADFQKLHPQLAQILGAGATAGGLYYGTKWTLGLASGLFGGGIALRGSAAALTGSAAALNAAAVRLGAGSVVGATAAASTVAGGTAVAGIGATLWRGGAIAGGLALLQLMNRDSETGHPLRSYLRSMFGIEDPHEPAPWQPGGQFHPLTDELLPENRRRFTLDDIRALGGTPLTDAAKAELTGNANIETKITVAPSPDFLTRIETMISNAIKGVVINGNAPANGTTGPTGSSMPEAEPHAAR